MLGVHTNIQQIGKSVAIFAKKRKKSPQLYQLLMQSLGAQNLYSKNIN